ncbi:MAG: hypothetical protein IT582_01360 [Opitutaceae bacterium]|nr:hypothetical protein [Opitutaceae bacterium]
MMTQSEVEARMKNLPSDGIACFPNEDGGHFVKLDFSNLTNGKFIDAINTAYHKTPELSEQNGIIEAFGSVRRVQQKDGSW